MRKLLIPLLAALALPTAVNAESVWLWLRATKSDGVSQEKILMKSMEQCEEEGKRWVMAGSRKGKSVGWRKFHCFIGK